MMAKKSAAAAAKATEKPVTETTELVPAAPSGGAVATVPPMQTNIGVEDMKRPLLKILQGLSPEVEQLGAKVGQFFATVLSQELGNELHVTVLGVKKEYILWNPQRGVDPMILARSTDGVTWDEGGENKTFDVKITNVGKVSWNTKGSVADSGLHLFGSSVPGNPDSKPALAETYNYLLFLHERDGEEEHGIALPVVVSLARSKIGAAKSLNTICFGNSAVDPRSLKVKLRITQDGDPGNEYFNLVPMRAGRLSPEKYDQMLKLAAKFQNFSSDIDTDEQRAERGRKPVMSAEEMAKAEY